MVQRAECDTKVEFGGVAGKTNGMLYCRFAKPVSG